MRKGLSVKDLAERIGGTRPEAERARMVEQLRYWTRLNLLEPAGPKHGGSGRWRTYPGSAVYVAAVLNEISRFRVSVPVMERLAEAIRYGLEGGAKDGPEGGPAAPDARPATFFASRLLEALEGSREVFLALYTGESTDETGIDLGYTPLDLEGAAGAARSAVVVNLTKVFTDLR